MTSDLRESVARAIYDALEGPVNNQDYARQVAQWNRAIEIADAAIDLVFEEAARVAEEYGEFDRKLIASATDDEERAAFERGAFKAANIAAAIRALATASHSTETKTGA